MTHYLWQFRKTAPSASLSEAEKCEDCGHQNQQSDYPQYYCERVDLLCASAGFTWPTTTACNELRHGSGAPPNKTPIRSRELFSSQIESRRVSAPFRSFDGPCEFPKSRNRFLVQGWRTWGGYRRHERCRRSSSVNEDLRQEPKPGGAETSSTRRSCPSCMLTPTHRKRRDQSPGRGGPPIGDNGKCVSDPASDLLILAAQR